MRPLERDHLFVYAPGFVDPALGGQRWFCPYSAQVVGFLSYYPEVRATLELVPIDFVKPRVPLVALVGERYQAAPILVLAPGSPDAPEDVHVTAVGPHRVVERTLEILRYLAATRGVPLPH